VRRGGETRAASSTGASANCTAAAYISKWRLISQHNPRKLLGRAKGHSEVAYKAHEVSLGIFLGEAQALAEFSYAFGAKPTVRRLTSGCCLQSSAACHAERSFVTLHDLSKSPTLTSSHVWCSELCCRSLKQDTLPGAEYWCWIFIVAWIEHERRSPDECCTRRFIRTAEEHIRCASV
jgi:hypothetical protein